MISDFPSSEEAELRRDYAASRKRLGAAPDSDLSQLAASSVVRSGVRAAEQKAGLKQLTEPWKNWRNMEKCRCIKISQIENMSKLSRCRVW